MAQDDSSPRDPRIGLCADCRNADLVRSVRGSTFYRCRLADADPRFAKYPTLPVVACPGYEPAAGDGDGRV